MGERMSALLITTVKLFAHIAADFGCKYWVEYFIALDADVNVRDCYGSTPLHKAIESFNFKFQVAERLMAGCEDSWGTVISNDSLYRTLCQRQLALAEALIFNGADVNVANSKGETVLHPAVKNGSLDLVELVLAADADVNVRDKDGLAPLTIALENSYIEKLKLLIANGADVNARDKSDRSVLHCAVQSNWKEIVELLLDNGADINAKRKASFTPLDDALESGNLEIADLLVASCALVNKQQVARISALLSLPDAKGKGYLNLVAKVQNRSDFSV
jgi:ankyrin repeat protein